MAFLPEFLDELRDRAGLAQIIGRRVRLVRKGREHSGLCPFHKEKTPSFTVNEDKGFYHCFGCGAHGSVIDFVMNTEGLGFREAVERLASEAGMALPAETPEERERARRRQSLLDVMDAAATRFERALHMPEGRRALSYLAKRGVNEDTIRSFRLGFALDSRDALGSAMARDGVPEDLMVSGGLIKRPDDGRPPFDYFRGRVIFPITDRRGRVIAFGGRTLGDGEPKYLNSPETPLFHKGRVLYGLAHAAAAARRSETLIVTEGYMDVIALHQAGFEAAVAPLGTALTEDQIGELWRLAREPVVCFDGDAAGGRAATRAALRTLPLLKPGYGLRFAVLPSGEDPDTLLAGGGRPALEAVLAAARPLSEVLWAMETEGRRVGTPEDRAFLEDKLKRHAVRIADPTVRGHFLTAFKDRLWRELKGAGGDTRGRPAVPAGVVGAGARRQPGMDPARRHEQILMAVLLTHPELYDDIGERLGSMGFFAPELDKLRQEALKTLAGDASLDSGALQYHLNTSGFLDTLNALLSPQVFEHAFFARPGAALATAREGWEETYLLYRQKDLRAEIEQARQRLSTDMTAESVERVRALKALEQQATDGHGRRGDSSPTEGY